MEAVAGPSQQPSEPRYLPSPDSGDSSPSAAALPRPQDDASSQDTLDSSEQAALIRPKRYPEYKH